jgi:hypothetical protein
MSMRVTTMPPCRVLRFDPMHHRPSDISTDRVGILAAFGAGSDEIEPIHAGLENIEAEFVEVAVGLVTHHQPVVFVPQGESLRQGFDGILEQFMRFAEFGLTVLQFGDFV